MKPQSPHQLVLSLILFTAWVTSGPSVCLVGARNVPAADDTDAINTKDSDEIENDLENDPGLDDPWLADFDGGNGERYVDYMEGMQADAPSSSSTSSSAAGKKDKDTLPARLQPSAWVCPPPPLGGKTPAHFCTMDKCKADAECSVNNQKCCFNGCVYACMNTLPPPPLVDWIKEPPRRLLAGNSWLVTGPEMIVPGDSCSTDFDPEVEDALLCAHGYICHILFPGNKQKGIPNRGRCIKEDTENESQGRRRFRLATRGTGTGKEDSDENVCVYENAIFVDGARFMYEHHECECLKNTITCTVGDDHLD